MERLRTEFFMRLVDGFVIYDLPHSDELNMDEINAIVGNTHNTWQKNRHIEELRQNTIQGKRAEYVIERFLRENSRYRYKSYDAIRADGYKKHAPFDGIISSQDIKEDVLKEAIDSINEDVKNSEGDTGTISVKTRDYLEDSGILTVEIKSSLLQDPRDYRTMIHKTKGNRTEQDYKNLCTYIREFYDFFVYPHYCRDNINIHSFYEYTVYLRNNNHADYEIIEMFLAKLMRDEFDNACNIYTRVFIDVLSDEIIIPGYIVKNRFFEEPRIQKMPSKKSINAIYYMYHMQYGKSLIEIDNDREISRFNRFQAYNELFGRKQHVCNRCNTILKLVESTRNHKFLFVCKCKNNKWHTMNEVYPINMAER